MVNPTRQLNRRVSKLMSTLRTDQAYVPWGCGALLFLIAVAYPMGVSAHVKWFANYNENVRPIPFSDVATPSFLLIYTGFVVIFFLGLLADAWLTKRWPGLTSAGETFLGFQEKWVRLGIGAFLLCMWSSHLNILTAELTRRWSGSSPSSSSAPFALPGGVPAFCPVSDLCSVSLRPHPIWLLSHA